MKIYKYVVKSLKGKIAGFILYTVLSLVHWGINFAVPYLTGNYIDNIVYSPDLEYLVHFIVLFLVIHIIGLVCSYIMNLLNTKLNTRMSFEISYHIYEHLKKVPISFFKNIDSVYVVSRINDDANITVAFFLNNCTAVFTQSAALFLSLFILYRIDKFLCFMLLVFLPAYILIYLFFRKKVYKANYKFKEAQSRYFSRMTEQFSAIQYLKLHSLFSFFSKRLKNAFSDLFTELIHNFNITYLFHNFNMIVSFLMNILLLFYAGLNIIKGTMTIGLYTIISACFSMLISVVHYFMNLGSSYQQALVSYDRLNELHLTEEEHNGDKMMDGITAISLKNFGFGYDERTLFSDISVTFQTGRIYCIRGMNGAGKTSFINAVLGLYQDLYKGSVYYNDVNMKEIDMYDLRKRLVSVAEQEPQMLHLSIYENLMHDSNVTIEKKEAVRLWAEIFGLDDKMDTIPEESLNLSGGEKQKLAIIRALTADCAVMVLDEPTSALDQHSTDNLIGILQALKPGKIIILISHDKSLIEIADRVIDI